MSAFGRFSRPASFLEAQPGGGGGPASVLGLGVPEGRGDGLGRLAVGTGDSHGVLELLDSGQFSGHGDSGNTPDNTILSRVLFGLGSDDLEMAWEARRQLPERVRNVSLVALDCGPAIGYHDTS